MAWEIVTKNDAKEFIRVPTLDIQDLWYDMALGLIEDHTGWTLEAQSGITERANGSGTDILETEIFPIQSVSSIVIESNGLSSGFYTTRWNWIQLLSYRGEDITDYGGLYSITEFPFGIGNVTITYNAGGYDSLPNKYKRATQLTMLMLIKEISTNFRGEGSDQMYKKYRPDRTQNPEEVLLNYGQHGKMQGILKANLPIRRLYA